MTLPKELTTVTPLSRYLSTALFILLPFIGFYLGIRYQSKLQINLQGASQESNCWSPLKTQQCSSTAFPSIIYRPVYVEYDIPTPEMQAAIEKTKSWKTYKNGNFSFKYPPNWEVKDLLQDHMSLAWLKNTDIYVGMRPVTLGSDVLASIRVTTDSPEEIAKVDYTDLIKKHGEKYYVFSGDFEDEILNLIYSTFRFDD